MDIVFVTSPLDQKWARIFPGYSAGAFWCNSNNLKNSSVELPPGLTTTLPAFTKVISGDATLPY